MEESRTLDNGHHADNIVSSNICADYSTQLKFAKLLEDGSQTILDTLKSLSEKAHAEDDSFGLLIVFGTFDNSDGKVFGVTQMGSNPLTAYKSIFDDDFKDLLLSFGQYDGAILVNRSGQIIAARTYLVIDNPNLISEEECGTKHRAAASFSKRPEVHKVFTMSEETLKVRQWHKGEVEFTYDPAQKEVAEISIPKRLTKSRPKKEETP